jgi:hypothetical protein
MCLCADKISSAALDGTHVNITSPPTQFERAFVNRYGNHRINVMVVCNANYVFYEAVVRWPGSVGDARVLTNSSLYNRFQNENFRPFPGEHQLHAAVYGSFLGAIILADSAYPVTNWLIPPVLLAHGNREHNFNESHRRTRRVVECALGVLKSRFRCLRSLRVMNIETAALIIKGCIALHNLCIADQPPTDEELDGNREDNGDVEYYVNVNEHDQQLRRLQLIQTFPD